MEERLRTTLRDRVDDVTTQPALHQRVQERADRYRRRRLLRLVPAGAAALGLALVVPSLLQGGNEVPRIEDLATQLPAGATMPDRVVTVDASGAVRLIDLSDGSTNHTYGGTRRSEAVPEIDVAPWDRSPIPAVHAAVATPSPEQAEDGGALMVGAYWVDASGDRVNLRGGSAVGGRFAVSPDGRWTASLLLMEDGDGWTLELASSPTDDADAVQSRPGVVVPAGSVVQDWTGSTDDAYSVSKVSIVTPEGLLLRFPLSLDGDPDDPLQSGDGVGFAWEETWIEQPVGERAVVAYASAHLGDDAGFVLAAGGDGTVVQAVDGDEVLGQVDVTELIGDQEPSVVALDAWGDTATLATPDGSWLLTHDGNGRFIEPVALPDGTVRAAPVGRDLMAEEEPTDEVEATEAPEETAPDRTPSGAPTAPIVQADATSVWLRPGGEATDVTLLDLADRDDASAVEVAVRPGSTVDDLTVAALVTEDGVTGLRHLAVVNGEPQPPVTVDDPVLAPNARADSGLTVHGLAWTPDGASLTWLERLGDDGPTFLRVAGWDDGPGTGEGPTDHDGFEAAGLDGVDARLIDWVDTADGWFVRFLATEGEPGTWVWRFERRADGSLAPTAGDGDGDGVPADHPVFSDLTPAEGSEPRWEVASLLAFAGYDEAAQPTVRLVDRTVGGLTITGPSPGESIGLPPELTEADQLDAAWLHRLPEDHLLLGADGRAFLHGDDGWVDLGPAVDAAPVR